jgi:pimeloyl-ACP methyl ester carboxylesterase
MVPMPTYVSYDGAELAYRELGEGPRLLVIPGGPARDQAYLGDLDALALLIGRTVVVPDLRGTGASQPDSDPVSHRADRIAADVAMLVDHLRAAPVDVLAHSAGANVALLLAERRPDLVSRLVLVTPGTRAVGLEAEDADWDAALERRAGEPWYDALRAALEAADPTPDQQVESEALFYGRWDAAARTHAASDPVQRNVAATGWFHDDAYDPERTRERLAGLRAPVRILLGELDPWPNARGGDELASLFPDASVAVLPGAGHFPWVDDATSYASAVRAALTH